MFRKNKIKLSVLLFVFLFVQFFGNFLFVDKVYAIPVEDIPLMSAFTAKWTYDKVESNLTAAALGSLVSGISYFLRKLAYDGAKYIAAGGKGQGALVFTQSPGDYFTTVASDSLSEAIGNLGTPFGLNLCAPPDLSVLTSLKVSLSKIYNNINSFKPAPGGKSLVPDGPQANCTWANFQNNWEKLPDQLGNDTISERFAKSLNDVTKTDFGTALVALAQLDQLATDKKEAALVERLEGQGFKAVTTLISGAIKSPASQVQEEAKALTAKEQAQQSASQVAGLYSSQAWPVFASALSIFINTLGSSLLDRILNKGLVTPPTGDPLDFGATALNNNRVAAEKAFSFLIAGLPQISQSSYNIIAQYSACPPTNPGLNNCVMDDGLVQALNREGNPLTIKEAMDPSVGLLHGDWYLVPKLDVVQNTDINCYRDAYCYSNIQKLRKARILPLGFEIAALKSNADKPYTLQEVVDGYNKCNSDFTPDSAFPFCHLIDPNWILTVPEARCEAQVNGPLLASNNSAQRASECVDFSTCLAYNSNGQCQAFGYCKQEENVWDIPGGTCPAQYNTCKTYTNSNGAIASYLSRTLDYGTCNIESVGCSAYSADQDLDQDFNGQWKNDSNVDLLAQASGREQVLYFNNKIANYSCPDSENGCSLFVYPATNQDVYMKKAPDYLGCYDTNLSTANVVDWPNTVADLTTLRNRSSQCADFAPVCIPEEVGCDEYTPKDGGTALTGVVGNNYCPSQCVGYETFKQQSTNFEQAQFPLYFIPKDGQSCAVQYAGCDEFTNLDNVSGEQLEYYTDLKYCQKPDGDNAKVYYAWEGSDSAGYILKKYNLWQVDISESGYIDRLVLSEDAKNDLKIIGSPRYFDDSSATLANNYDYCNATKYSNLIHNPWDVGNIASLDCREFHDTAGNIFYRLLGSTVSVLAQCQPLRKTEANFYKDVDVVNDQTTCEGKNGKWDSNTNSCMRCMGGGEYTRDNNGNSYCKYWSIPSEAQSCPAVVNGCRIYIGNNGNNLRHVYSTSFEPGKNEPDALLQARQDWGTGELDTTISVEPEATQVGLYSLKVNNDTTLNLSSDLLESGNWYQLSFWAHGDNSKVDIHFGKDANNFGSFTTDPLTGTNIPVVVGNEWQEYTLGPVMFSGNADAGGVVDSGVSTWKAEFTGIQNQPVGDGTYAVTLWGSVNATDIEVYDAVYLGIDETQFDTLGPSGDQIAIDLFDMILDINPPALCSGTYGNCIFGDLSNNRSVANNFLQNSTGTPDAILVSNASKSYANKIKSDLETLVQQDNVVEVKLNSRGENERTLAISALSQFAGYNDADAGTFFDTYYFDNSGTAGVIKDNLTESDADTLIANLTSQLYSSLFSASPGNLNKVFLESSVVPYPKQPIIDELIIIGLNTSTATVIVNAGSGLIRTGISQTEAQAIESAIGAVGGQVTIQEISSVPVTNPNDAVISFNKTDGTGSYFIDNVRLVNMAHDSEQYVPLIKNSWKTPEGYDVSPICDSSPTDAYPGEYLGCREYKTRDNNIALILSINPSIVTFTGFQNLCRKEAVGCVGLVDTHNIPLSEDLSLHKVAYNLLCFKDKISLLGGSSCDVTIDDSDYSCTVEIGQSSCHIEGPVNIYSESSLVLLPATIGNIRQDTAFIDPSTVIVPVSPAKDADLVYLAVTNDYLCRQSYLGCQEVGVQNQILPVIPGEETQRSYEFSNKTILNNPANYGETLCVQEQKSCSQFTSDKNISFFKDPLQNSGALCVYQDSKQINSTEVKGWFLDGVGRCGVNINDVSGSFCKEDKDCVNGLTCNGIGNQACYPNYLDASGEYGLYSNGSQGYENFVGSCDPAYNGCTQLVDPTDKQDYYVINDDRLFANKSECEGKVSQKEGCVLFDMTENPNKFYDSVTTYQDSKKIDYLPVEPVTSSSLGLDSNTFIKVDRDRQCGQWLSCSTSKTEIDDNGIAQELCTEYKSCNKMGLGGECAQDGWVQDSLQSINRLTESVYLKKNFSNFGTDYSGLSIFNKFDPSGYVYLIFPNHKDVYIAYQANDRLFAGEYAVNGCFNTANITNHDGDVCGGNDGGRCFNQKCLYPIDGVFDNQVKPVNSPTPEVNEKIIQENIDAMLSKMEHGTCKSYPETSSPFDTNIALDVDLTIPEIIKNFEKKNNSSVDGPNMRLEYTSGKKAGFGNANICQFNDGGKGNCSCDYIKVEYKNGAIDYWPGLTKSEIPTGICSGTGNKDDQPCSEDIDCGANGVGICNKQKQVGNFIGFKGLCLEYDFSRPLTTISDNAKTYDKFACLTWLPIQVSASSYDLYNTALEAGYYPVKDYDSEYGGLAYCKEAQSVYLAYDKNMHNVALSTDPYLYDQDINSNSSFEVWLGSYFTTSYYYNYSRLFGNGEIKNSSLFNEGKISYGTSNEGVDVYRNEGDYRDIVTRAKDDLDNKKTAHKTFQVWGWRNLSANARLLRLDLQNDNGKEKSMFRYDKGLITSNITFPNDDKTVAMFSFAPVLSIYGVAQEDTGAAMHPPRLWDSNFDVPKKGSSNNIGNVFNYFSVVNAGINSIETSAFSPDFDASSTDNNYIYVDTAVEKNINEYMLDRVYFVPIILPDGGEGNNPSVLSNKFYIDFSYLRRKADKSNDLPIETHSSPTCYGGNDSLCISSSVSKKVTSYLLERNQGSWSDNCSNNGLMSFCNYNSAFLLDQSQNSRNKIYRRYVTVFNFELPVGTTVDSLIDPFKQPCVVSVDDTASNFMAIGMDFNKDGEFLGYISRWCNNFEQGDDEEGNGISFATFAQFANVCTDVVSVVNDDSQQLGDYNKAWTDRVWENALGSYGGFICGADIRLNSAIIPYGSLESSVNQTSLNVTKFSDLPTYIRFYSFPQGNNNLGSPYWCGTALFPDINYVPYIFDPSFDHTSLPKLFKKYYTEWFIPTATPTTSPFLNKDFSGGDLENTKPPKIFAIDYLTCDSNQSENCPSTKEGITINSRNYPIDNTDPTWRNEDNNHDGAVDPMIGYGSYKANVRFFAYADDNRMPIKRVMIDWGDNSYINDIRGSYKNRKPYCQSDSNVGRCTNRATWQEGDSQLTCKENIDCINSLGAGYTCDKLAPATSHFGDQDRACMENYFEFSHTYFCDRETAGTSTLYTLSDIRDNGVLLFGSPANASAAYNQLKSIKVGEAQNQTLNDNDTVCVYKPGVQILDNWGWCNGSCVDGYHFEGSNVVVNTGPQSNIIEGCYNDLKLGIPDGSGFADLPQCISSNIIEGAYPWTDYNGAIIVIP